MLNLNVYGYNHREVCDLAASCDDFRHFIDAFYERPLSFANKKVWAEKSPTNIYCIQEFLSLYPSGRYIHVVRDGRDVIPSLMQRGYTPEAAVRRWIHDTVAGYPHRKSNRYIEVKYEDLVNRPEETLEILLGFLHIDERAATVLQNAKNNNGVYKGLKTWGIQPNQEISAKAMFKWKQGQFWHKGFIEQLFYRTCLVARIATRWGLPVPCTGNEVLSLFGYDSTDEWNRKPGYGLRFIWHYLQERLFSILSPRKLCCTVSFFESKRQIIESC
jgi:hypothetical protein